MHGSVAVETEGAGMHFAYSSIADVSYRVDVVAKAQVQAPVPSPTQEDVLIRTYGFSS